MQDHLAQDRPETLYHYTQPAGIIGICTKRYLLAGHPADMNDRREQAIAADLCRDILHRRGDALAMFTEHWLDNYRGIYRGTRSISNDVRRIYTVSLTALGDSLEQWRAYGSAEGSMAIGFGANDLLEVAAAQYWSLVPCLYDSDRQRDLCHRLVEWIEPKIVTPAPGADDLHSLAGQFDDAVNDLGAIFKDECFRSESEWRVLSPAKHGWEPGDMEYLPGTRGVRDFVKFRLDGGNEKYPHMVTFCLGPNGDWNNMLRIADTLGGTLAQEGVHYRYSATTYRL